MSVSTAPDFDLSMIRSVAGDDLETERELIQSFIAETRKNLERLNSHTSMGVNQNWVDTAHTIKGGAANVGASDLRDLCLAAQKMNAATTTVRDRLEISKRIHSSAQRLIAALQQQVKA